jgi:hypothetical protein
MGNDSDKRKAARRRGGDTERIAALEARLRSLGQHPDADPECGYCNGSGERYWHSEDCRDDYCALAGGYHDCRGQVEECACIGTARARGEVKAGSHER